jgi:hypothetical protein
MYHSAQRRRRQSPVRLFHFSINERHIHARLYITPLQPSHPHPSYPSMILSSDHAFGDVPLCLCLVPVYGTKTTSQGPLSISPLNQFYSLTRTLFSFLQPWLSCFIQKPKVASSER